MLSLHNIHLLWSSHFSLEIECAHSEAGALVEDLSLPSFLGAELSTNTSHGTPPLSYEVDDEGLYQSLRLRENAKYFVAVTVPYNLIQAEEQFMASKNENRFWPFLNSRLRSVVSFLPPKHWKESQNESGVTTKLIGTMNFGSFVGVVDLSISNSSELLAEVASEKIDYFKDFKILLQEVADDIVDLLISIDSVAGVKFLTKSAVDARPAIQLFHLRRIMSPNGVPSAIESILQQPFSRLESLDRFDNPASVAHIEPMQVAYLAPVLPYMDEGPVESLFMGRSPKLLPDRSKRDTVDTPENRFVKAFLEDLMYRFSVLSDLLKKSKKLGSLREVEGWETVTSEWLSHSVWKEVSRLTHIPSNSQVLQRHKGYKEVLDASVRLDHALELPWARGIQIAETIGDIRPIFELYEYWCYFTLRKVLREICGPEAPKLGSFYSEKDGGLEINLRRGQLSKLEFSYLYQKEQAVVNLFYNRIFQRDRLQDETWSESYSVDFHPDFSILVKCSDIVHWLHFDAKYKLDMNKWRQQILTASVEDIESDLLTDDEDNEVFAKSDLYKMHTYRDALLGSRGAYILFPGLEAEPNLFIRHPQRIYKQDHKLPSIGAFALNPSQSAQQVRSLTSFLRKMLSEITQESALYQEETAFSGI